MKKLITLLGCAFCAFLVVSVFAIPPTSPAIVASDQTDYAVAKLPANELPVRFDASTIACQNNGYTTITTATLFDEPQPIPVAAIVSAIGSNLADFVAGFREPLPIPKGLEVMTS